MPLNRISGLFQIGSVGALESNRGLHRSKSSHVAILPSPAIVGAPKTSIGPSFCVHRSSLAARAGLRCLRITGFRNGIHERNFLQALDKPSTRGTGRRFGLPDRRHRDVETTWGNIFDRQRFPAPLFEILADGVERHAALSKAIADEVMLRKQVRKAPGHR